MYVTKFLFALVESITVERSKTTLIFVLFVNFGGLKRFLADPAKAGAAL